MALSEMAFALSDHSLSDEEISNAYKKSQEFFNLSDIKHSYVIPEYKDKEDLQPLELSTLKITTLLT